VNQDDFASMDLATCLALREKGLRLVSFE